MKSFTIIWSELGLNVTCNTIAQNTNVLDLFCANLPIQSLQGHEVTGGWMLRNRSIHFNKKAFTLDAATMNTTTLDKAPVGTVCLLFPQGSSAELVIKYDDCVDNRDYVPFAQVSADDIPALKAAGKAAWKSASRTKDIIVCKIEGVE